MFGPFTVSLNLEICNRNSLIIICMKIETYISNKRLLCFAGKHYIFE